MRCIEFIEMCQFENGKIINIVFRAAISLQEDGEALK
jgi:hypothetical protein